jgi:TonB family protein
VPREITDRGPRGIYTPDPEYSEKARRLKINGTVILSLIVGIDGLPRNVKVEKGIGYGLDENALEAVRKWKFQPAMKNRRLVETHISVTTSFELY